MKIFKNINLMALVGVLLACGCGKGQQEAAVRPPVPVTSVAAVAKDVPLYIETIGCCAASENVSIVSQVSGQIVNVAFQQGQHLKSGDLMFVIDRRRYEANLKKAEAELGMSKSKLKVDLAQLERSKALLPQSYISQQQYEAYEAMVEQDVATVSAAEAQVQQATIDLENCNITSPIDGIAGQYLVDVGNVIGSMSLSQPLTTVQNVDPLYVEFSISENSFHDLQKYFKENGDCLKVEVSPISNDSVKGEANLTFINNAINKSTGSINLRASMPNAEHSFWPGQSVRVKVFLCNLKDAVVLPAEAVKLGQKGRYVFVIKDDKSVELRFLEPGQIHGDMLVINNGLRAGEVVVKCGQLMLAPGAKVVEMPDEKSNKFEESLKNNKAIAEKNPTSN